MFRLRYQQHKKALSTMTECSDSSYESVGLTSTSLLDRLKAGDELAWRRLVRVYGQLVLYWCRFAGVRREDRVDVCQEVFRAVASNIEKFRHDQPSDTFRGWLRTITRSKLADHFRRQNRQPVAIGGSVAQERFLALADCDTNSAAAEAGDQEKAILVKGVLDLICNEFEDRTWQAFWRVTVDCQSSGVVAESLEMTPAAVRQAKSRVLRRLREELHQLLEQDGCILERVDDG
jgi:RNA polymerase sigma-70 factor, ECF subfamily